MDAPEGFRHFVDVRVRFAETDAQGVVYHASFLVYCEVARIEYFRALGRPHRDERAYETVIAHAACDYRAPARFDDLLRVWIRLGRLGGSSIGLEYRIARHDGTLVCEARTVQVCVDKKTRQPIPIPEELRTAMTAFQAGGELRVPIAGLRTT
jgi:acyl-CoA thioester hydrolase